MQDQKDVSDIANIIIRKHDRKEIKKITYDEKAKLVEKVIDLPKEKLTDCKERIIYGRINIVMRYFNLDMNDKKFIKENIEFIMDDKCIIKYKNFLNLICLTGFKYQNVVDKNFNIDELKSNDGLMSIVKDL